MKAWSEGNPDKEWKPWKGLVPQRSREGATVPTLRSRFCHYREIG